MAGERKKFCIPCCQKFCMLVAKNSVFLFAKNSVFLFTDHMCPLNVNRGVNSFLEKNISETVGWILFEEFCIFWLPKIIFN
jgi:hypothetical protein